MRVERGKDRAEAVVDKTERKRRRGRRGEGRNVSLLGFFLGGLCLLVMFIGLAGRRAEDVFLWVETDGYVCVNRLIGMS